MKEPTLEVIDSFGSSGRIRTYNPSVNSRMLYRCATEEHLHATICGQLRLANSPWRYRVIKPHSLAPQPAFRCEPIRYPEVSRWNFRKSMNHSDLSHIGRSGGSTKIFTRPMLTRTGRYFRSLFHPRT
jgi:hypothetical protein